MGMYTGWGGGGHEHKGGVGWMYGSTLLGKYNNGGPYRRGCSVGCIWKGIYIMGVHTGEGMHSLLFLLAILARYQIVYINF